jgi:hypothetical protein
MRRSTGQVEPDVDLLGPVEPHDPVLQAGAVGEARQVGEERVPEPGVDQLEEAVHVLVRQQGQGSTDLPCRFVERDGSALGSDGAAWAEQALPG